MWEVIPSGPVAQFSPIEKRGNGSMAARAAATSVPTSIVPVLSIVRETITGTSRFIRSSVSKQETSAILTWSRSWHVSTISRSAPASTSAPACSEKAAAIGSKAMCPSDGSFVVGPMDPATYAAPPCRRIASRALPTAARLISATRSARPYALREDDRVRAEGVRRGHRRPGGEEGGMPLPDHFGGGNVEEFVAPLPP